MTEYKPSIIVTHSDGKVTRLVDPKAVTDYLELVRFGLLTSEEAHRRLYPEEAADIYDPSRITLAASGHKTRR